MECQGQRVVESVAELAYDPEGPRAVDARYVQPDEVVLIATSGVIVNCNGQTCLSTVYSGPQPPTPVGEPYQVRFGGGIYTFQAFKLAPGTLITEYSDGRRRHVWCKVVEDEPNPPPGPNDGVTAPTVPTDPSRSYGAAEQIPDEAAERELLGVG